MGKYKVVEIFESINGEGRKAGQLALFVRFQRCNLRCSYCDTMWANGEDTPHVEMTADEIYERVVNSGIKNITLTGGEPLLQHEFLYSLLEALGIFGFHTAIDTNGFIDLKYSKKCIDKANMILLDIKEVDEDDCIALTEYSNKNTLKTLDYAQSINKCVWIRYVCVPGYTLNMDKIHKLGKLLSSYSCVEKVQLIPFHQLGSYKYKELQIPYQLENVKTPTNEEMAKAQNILKQYNLPL